MTTPVPVGPRALAVGEANAVAPQDRGGGGGALAARERDFLLLTVFVLAQQGYVDRAGVLAEALYLCGETDADVQLARAVLRFLAGEWAASLACLRELDRIDPIERFGAYTLTEPHRMRRFLVARCLFEVGDRAGAKEALDSYLRHGGPAGRAEP